MGKGSFIISGFKHVVSQPFTFWFSDKGSVLLPSSAEFWDYRNIPHSDQLLKYVGPYRLVMKDEETYRIMQ